MLMKRLTKMTLLAILIAAMGASVAEAQPRTGSNSRGGSNTRPTQNRTTNVQSKKQPAARPQQATPPRQATPPKQATPPRQSAPSRQSARPQQPPRQQQGNFRSEKRYQQPGRPQQSRPQSVRPQPDRAQPNRAQPGAVRHRPVQHTRPLPPPARREPIHHHHSHAFWHRGPHYYGYRVTVLPSHHVRHVHWGVPYYIVDNVYYRLRNGHYYVCRPPYGVVFNPVAESIAYAACKFAFYASVVNTYNTVNQNAALITQQNATIAANNALIAQQNATIALNNNMANASYSLANRLGLVQSYGDASLEYFYDDGVFFTKKADGSYVTMVPPAGALVQELPEDYEMRVLADGEEYYVVDNTVFRLSIVEGKPYFEVIGQLTESA